VCDVLFVLRASPAYTALRLCLPALSVETLNVAMPETLNKELNRSEDRGRQVRDRIDSVRSVSDDLFTEWDKETRLLRSVDATRERAPAQGNASAFETLIRSMEKAQRRIEPVLKPLRDFVLFLKHHPNAKAIGALDAELVTVRTNVDALIADLEAALSEADQLVAAMGTPGGPSSDKKE